jgi:hypothetical protein
MNKTRAGGEDAFKINGRTPTVKVVHCNDLPLRVALSKTGAQMRSNEARAASD